MNLKNKSALITGGAGFIGSHLVDCIIKDDPDNVIVVDNFFLGKEENLIDAKENYPKLKIYNQDVSEYEEMKKIFINENIDIVFDLAVLPLPASLTKPKWVFEKNVTMTATMCELARNDLYDTLIHMSSSEVYGTLEYPPMDENHPLNGRTPYAASKAASDQLIYSYIKTFNTDMAIVRPFNNYGPRQNEKTYAGVIPITIKRILNGDAPVIHGDGKQTRDYLFVTDTANATLEIYNKKKTRGKTINVARGEERSIEFIIEEIKKILSYNKPTIFEPERKGDVRRHFADTSLVKRLIDFEPKVNFEEGLKRTIKWYQKKYKKENLI